MVGHALAIRVDRHPTPLDQRLVGGLHVLGAAIWLMVILMQARHGRFMAQNHTGVQICGMYWTFVVGLWPILYGLVYLF